MLVANEVDNALKLRTLETLLTALDNCSDVVQITDHEDRIIFQNSAGEKFFGYSSSDYLSGERHLWDFQSTSAMYSHAVLEENVTAVKIIFVLVYNFQNIEIRGACRIIKVSKNIPISCPVIFALITNII